MPRILTVDDEDGIRALLVDSLAELGHDLIEAPNGEAALRALEDQPIDLMLLDLRMPGTTDGMAVLRAARARWPETLVIVLTAYGTVSTAVEAMRLGAFDFMEKPLESPEAIRRLVTRALNWRAHFSAARPSVGEMVEESSVSAGVATDKSGISRLMEELRRRQVYQVAAAYAAAAFVILQIGELVFPVLPIPEWSYAGLVALSIAGLPVALMLGWIYDVSLSRTGRITVRMDR